MLAVAGCAFALVGGFALFAREEIFNADAFADNSAEALKDEQFREALRVRSSTRRSTTGRTPSST